MVKRDEQPEYLNRVKKIIETDYRDSITVEEICTQVNVSPSTLQHAFRKYFDFTIHHYLNKIRTDRAKYLLTEKDYLIYDIARQVGYNSPAAFTSAFKKITGFTPKEYRRQKPLEE